MRLTGENSMSENEQKFNIPRLVLIVYHVLLVEFNESATISKADSRVIGISLHSIIFFRTNKSF